MFHDKRFKLKYTVDKCGRPVSQTSTEDLKRFYKLSDSEESDEEEENEKTEKPKKEKKVKKADEEPQVEDEDESDESEEEEDAEKIAKSKEAKKTKEPLIKGVRVFEEDEDEESGVEEDEEEDGVEEGPSESEEEDADEDDDESESDEDSDRGPDLAQGKGNIETSSDEDDDDELEDYLRHEEEEIEHDWGEMWKDAPHSDNISQRLAVCNMNWDRLKTEDLLALFSSFKPKGGVVLSLTIYPSEFRKERISAEQTQGPLELIGLPENPDAETEEQRICREKVRDYQFKRLRYYYVVVECDSIETAAKIYEECDGYEYESSCSMIDLRFIPDDVTFDDEPKDRATDVDYSSYKPKLFTSTATTTANVELTWDETDHDRVTALFRKFNKDDLLDMDFKAYLASSSEEEEDEEEAEEPTEAEKPVEPLPEEKKGSKGKKSTEQIAKYRELLKSIQDKDKKDDSMDMEVTWVPAYKKTKTTQSILEEKQRRREEQQHSQEEALKSKAAEETPSSSTKVMDPSLSLLIKSIKNKTEQFQARKKQKTK